jgi:antitoxin ParD1/3/4
MNVDLPAEQQEFIERLVASGRYPSADDAISDGVRLLVCQERLRQQVDIGIEQARSGNLLDHDTVFGQLKAMAAAAAAQSETGQ